jgi:hypothetical protein
MNIQNITALAEQLQSLGFDDPGSLLLKRICFNPACFYLSQRIAKGNDKLEARLYFEKGKGSEVYVLKYYDMTLLRENDFEEMVIAGIRTSGLMNQMASIDWKKAFNVDEKKQWTPEDKTSWENESRVETVIESLGILEQDEKGKVIASFLKFKFWNGVPFQEIVGNIPVIKNKSDVSQRFYFSEKGTGISIDEAYRFLQNKCIEKQIHYKKKQGDEIAENENGETSSTGGSGLLKKRRINQSLKGKRNKANLS